MASPDETSEHPVARRSALAIVALIGLWVLTGAVFKLGWGTPNDLPQVVKDAPFAIGTTYKLAIAIELSLAVLAFLRPRWAWPLCVGALVVFDAVLVTQIAQGTETCGCFGSKIPIPPAVMLAIDTTLLVALLATRPWSSLAGSRGGALLPLALCAAAVATPWLLDRETRIDRDGGTAVAGGDEEDGGNGGGTRRWVSLELDEWVGEDVGDTPLGRWVDVYAMPPDALWILYRWTCDHCAEHLARLADEEIGQRYLVLVRLKEPADTDENRLVHRMPTGDFVFHAELPDTVEYVITTPGELEVEGYRVVHGAEAVGGDHDES